jgi:hypothetical protein
MSIARRRTSRGALLLGLGGLLLLVPGAASVGLGCSTCKPTGGTAEGFEGGQVLGEDFYETSAPGERMLDFPSGKIYDIAHQLGRTPALVEVYVSFKEQLVPGDDPYDPYAPNNVSLAAGNQAVIEAWDDEIIRVRNDTCADYYLRVVAVSAGPGGQGGQGGAAP